MEYIEQQRLKELQSKNIEPDPKWEKTCNEAGVTGVILNCEIHGDYEEKVLNFGFKDIKLTNCMKCQAEKNKSELEELKALENKLSLERVYENRIDCGVPKRNVGLTFEDFKCDTIEQQAAKTKVLNWKEKFDRNKNECPSMIITGSVGTGKTMLASCLVNSVTEQYRSPARLIKLIDMIRALKETWRKDSEKTESRVIEILSNIPMLIIDEVGMSFDSDTEKMFIFDVIDGRYQNKLPTVIISNLNIEGIKNSMGERVVDRLRDGGGVLIGCDWPSMRK